MSWKKFGGKNVYEKTESLRVKNLVAENFTLQDLFKGNITLDAGSFITELDIESGRNAKLERVFVNDRIYFLPTDEYNIDTTTFVTGDNDHIGINVLSPQATLDICANAANILQVYSSPQYLVS